MDTNDERIKAEEHEKITWEFLWDYSEINMNESY